LRVSDPARKLSPQRFGSHPKHLKRTGNYALSREREGVDNVIRSTLLAASRNPWLERQFRTRKFTRRAVRKFMPGESLDEALEAAKEERSRGAGVLLTLLGENVADRDEAMRVSGHYKTVLERFRNNAMVGEGGPPSEISVKLTHLGLDLGDGVAGDAMEAILAHPGAKDGTVWVDMEDSSYVDRTLEIYLDLLSGHSDLGICLQAYLRRTPADLERVLEAGGCVRLVKGAYREPAEVAFPKKADVDRAYVELGRVLKGRPPGEGRRHVLGTHDPKMVEGILGAEGDGGATGLEVQMLYGIAREFQQELLDRGVPFGCLISYGDHWFPWYMRRLAERPANIGFVVRSIFRA
jgi:proline dehydrogenase